MGRAWDNWVVKQRGPKSKLTAAELRLAWEAIGREHGFGLDQVEELVELADLRRAIGVPKRDAISPQADELCEVLLARVNREHAYITKGDLGRLARQLAVGLVPGD